MSHLIGSLKYKAHLIIAVPIDTTKGLLIIEKIKFDNCNSLGDLDRKVILVSSKFTDISPSH
jgi:hypothetical protein